MPAGQFFLPYRKEIICALCALIFTAGVTLFIGQGIKLLIDRGFSQNSIAYLQQNLLIFFVLVIMLAAGTFIRYYFVSWLGERIVADLRIAVFNHLINMHPGYFEKNHTGEIQSRVTADTALLQTVIGSSISIGLRNILMFIGGLIWLFISNPKLTSIALGVIPIVIIPIIFFGRRVKKLSRDNQDKIASLGSNISESLKNIKIIQAYNYEKHQKKIFQKFVEEAFLTAKFRILQRSTLIVVVITLVLGAIAVMLWVGGIDVLEGRTTPGELAAFIFYAVIVAGSLGVISEIFTDVQRAIGALERLLELLQVKSDIISPENPIILTSSTAKISFNNVTFYYPTRPTIPALQNINFTIGSGQQIALVGKSGAGKSTIVDLLLRFYDPQVGKIDIDNHDIKLISLQQLRENMALVPQQPTLFTGSVIDNIRYGKAEATYEEIIDATVTAYADEFIKKLPEGYNTQLGEGGIRLSGGQRQRIAIARAVLSKPNILLLDEATNSLDANSESYVQMALDKYMKECTTLIIAHRLATVINADLILVLDKGKIVAQGTHTQLLESSTIYRRLAELQFNI